MNFVEICNVYIGKMIIKAAKSIFNSDKICRSYSDLNFGVTFLEHSVHTNISIRRTSDSATTAVGTGTAMVMYCQAIL